MRALKLIAIVCACVLAFGATVTIAADQVTREDEARDLRAASVEATGAEAGDTVGGNESRAADAPSVIAPPQARGRKKENAIVRILAAPFRGMARLFGGGRGRRKAARVSVETAPRREEAMPARPARADSPKAGQKSDQQSDQQIETALPQPAPLAAELERAVTPAPTSPERPAPTLPVGSEGDKESYEPAPFTPLIVGVPSDPLSQGRALLERGYLSEAIAELSVAAVTGQSLAEANNLLGLAYDRQGRHKEANEAFERALSSAPADPHLLNNLGYSLYLNGYYVAAVVRLRQAARLAPGNPHVLNNLALVYGRLRKYDEAFKHYTRAGGELYARLQTGALLDFAGRDRDAIKQFEAARRLDPASTEALRRLIKLYNRTGQRDKAEAARQELDRPKAKSSAASS